MKKKKSIKSCQQLLKLKRTLLQPYAHISKWKLSILIYWLSRNLSWHRPRYYIYSSNKHWCSLRSLLGNQNNENNYNRRTESINIDCCYLEIYSFALHHDILPVLSFQQLLKKFHRLFQHFPIKTFFIDKINVFHKRCAMMFLLL